MGAAENDNEVTILVAQTISKAKTSSQNANAAIDNQGTISSMSQGMTREELDAKLELVEARADARMSRFEERIDLAIKEMQRDRQEIKAEFSKLETEQKSNRNTIIVTVISSALATVFGIAAFNATVLSNMVASFDSGRSTAESISKASQQLEETRKMLEDLKKGPKR